MKAPKKRREPSTSRNFVCMRERRDDTAYRQRENERRRGLKKNNYEEEIKTIPPCFILSETSDNIARETGVTILGYVVRKKLEIIRVTTFLHAKMKKQIKKRERSNHLP